MIKKKLKYNNCYNQFGQKAYCPTGEENRSGNGFAYLELKVPPVTNINNVVDRKYHKRIKKDAQLYGFVAKMARHFKTRDLCDRNSHKLLDNLLNNNHKARQPVSISRVVKKPYDTFLGFNTTEDVARDWVNKLGDVYCQYAVY